MKHSIVSSVFVGVLACWGALSVIAEDRYLYFNWEVTYGTIYPLGFPQQVGHFCMSIEMTLFESVEGYMNI